MGGLTASRAAVAGRCAGVFIGGALGCIGICSAGPVSKVEGEVSLTYERLDAGGQVVDRGRVEDSWGWVGSMPGKSFEADAPLPDVPSWEQNSFEFRWISATPEQDHFKVFPIARSPRIEQGRLDSRVSSTFHLTLGQSGYLKVFIPTDRWWEMDVHLEHPGPGANQPAVRFFHFDPLTGIDTNLFPGQAFPKNGPPPQPGYVAIHPLSEGRYRFDITTATAARRTLTVPPDRSAQVEFWVSTARPSDQVIPTPSAVAAGLLGLVLLRVGRRGTWKREYA